jgi:Ankyrin repeats (many copies)
MWAAYSTDSGVDFAEPILKAGVDVNARDKNGDTALMWALRSGNLAMVRRLERAGASRDVPVRATVQKAIALLQASAPSSPGYGFICGGGSAWYSIAVAGQFTILETSRDRAKIVSLLMLGVDFELRSPGSRLPRPNREPYHSRQTSRPHR